MYAVEFSSESSPINISSAREAGEKKLDSEIISEF